MSEDGDKATRPNEASGRGPEGERSRRRRFPKAARLKNSDRFTAVIRKGGFAADETLVVHVSPNDSSLTRFGITIPRRTGNAVVRNRWKRLIRESIRHCRADLPKGYDIIIRPKRDAEPRHQSIMRGLPKTIRRAIRRLS